MTSHAGPEAYVVRLRAGNPFRPADFVAITPEIDSADPAATVYGVHFGHRGPMAAALEPSEALVPHPTVTESADLCVYTTTDAARIGLDRNPFGELILSSLGLEHLAPVHGSLALTMAELGELSRAVAVAVVGAMDTARRAEDDRLTAAAVADPATVAAARAWLTAHTAAGEWADWTPADVAALPAEHVIHAIELRYLGDGLYGFQRDHAADIATTRED